jgi:hypothetical protein
VSASPPPDQEPEFVGASERPVELAGASASIEVVIDPRAVQAQAAELGASAPTHAYLNLEDVEAERNPSLAYEVFVSTPDAGGDTPFYVGNVSFFGIEHLSSEKGDDDGPHGFRRTFDISDRVAELRAHGAWDDRRLTVSFRPVSLIPPPASDVGPTDAEAQETAEARSAPVRIGRVSVFYA